MATADDIEFRQFILEMVDEFDRQATWTSISNDEADYDPATGDANPTDTPYTIDVAPAEGSHRFAPGANTIEGDLVIVFAAQGLAFTPKQGDTCTLDGVEWQVLSVTPKPATAPIYAWFAGLVR